MGTKKKRDDRLRWGTQASFIAYVQSEDDKLGVIVSQTGARWTAFAVESDGNDVHSVLDSHAHHVIGEYETVPEAFAACDAYVSQWIAGKRADKCDCEDIEGKGTNHVDQRGPKDTSRASRRGRAQPGGSRARPADASGGDAFAGRHRSASVRHDV